MEAERSKAQSARRSLPSFDNPLGAAGVCILLALIFASVLFGGDFVPFTLRLTGVFGPSPPQPSRVSDTGMIVFTPFDGNSCRVVSFSNRTGSFGPDQSVRCDEGVPPERDAPAVRQAGPSERMQSIHQAFSSRPAR